MILWAHSLLGNLRPKTRKLEWGKEKKKKKQAAQVAKFSKPEEPEEHGGVGRGPAWHLI